MKKRNFSIVKTLIVLIGLAFSPLPALAGSLDSPAAPTSSGSAMYTLEDIYNRVNAGTAGTKRTGAFTEPTSTPGASGRTLDEVMGKAPAADNTNGCLVGEVANAKPSGACAQTALGGRKPVHWLRKHCLLAALP